MGQCSQGVGARLRNAAVVFLQAALTRRSHWPSHPTLQLLGAESEAGHICASCRRQITLRSWAVTHIPAQGKHAQLRHRLWGAKNHPGFVLQDVQLAECGADGGTGRGGGERGE